MVFDKPPNNSLDVPFYFIKQLYAEFVLVKHVNYFDIQPFEGVGLVMPQNRLGAIKVVQGPYVPLLLLIPHLQCNIQISFVSQHHIPYWLFTL